MKAMILAAGFGARLWPLTVGRTKPAIPFLNRPLIAYTIEYLRQYGIEDLIINLHHEPDSVRQQIGDGSQYGVRISYSVEEPEILGTSGALDRVRDQLENETFVVVNGKIITDLDLGAAIRTHRERKALATLVLRPNPHHERFSEVHITADDGRIEKFGGFPDPTSSSLLAPPSSLLAPPSSLLAPPSSLLAPPSSLLAPPSSPLMFTGIHILDPAVFDYIPRGVSSDFVRDVYPKAMLKAPTDGTIVAAHVAQGSWYELSTIERYLTISLEFLRREGRDLILDEGCEIEPGAMVERSILWRRVRVEGGARLTECIVGDDVTIPAGAEFHRSVLFRADQAPLVERPEKSLPGTIENNLLVVPFA